MVNIPSDVIMCSELNCDNPSHKDKFNAMYMDMCKCLLDASDSTIVKCKNQQSSDFVVPGWNDYVKDLHDDARGCYLLWRNLGKPRYGPGCEAMRRSRLSFKYALRQCKNQEERRPI
jgi:hypothetical protein